MKHVNPHIGRVGMQILVLVAVAGFVTTVAIFPGISVAIAPFIKKKRYPKKQFVEKNIESLLAHGLLKRARPKAGKERLMLTTKGRWELGIRGFAGAENASKTKPDKWDDTWRIIIFDVPESKRKLRSELRRAVRMYGFVQLQKSVWIYPYPCDDFVALVKRYLGIPQDVLYLTANQLEHDAWLRKEFNI